MDGTKTDKSHGRMAWAGVAETLAFALVNGAVALLALIFAALVLGWLLGLAHP